MDLTSLLRPLHENSGASFLPYGPASGQDGPAIEVVDTFGAYEAEYAVIRKSVGLMDLPQAGVVEVTGTDRLGFLHRMLTHDTAGLQPGQGRRAFMLNQKGRIEADLLVLHESQRTWLVTDRYQASHVVDHLAHYVITEDVQLSDATRETIHLALHGPLATAVVSDCAGQAVNPLEPLGHQRFSCAGQSCLLFRSDDTGALGLHVLVPRSGAVGVYEELCREIGGGQGQARGRPIGWLAYNTARIEAGTPIYHIDFGPDSLPHETGVLNEAVSFTKGCYLGQEVVARMQSLGHPKRLLVGLKCADDRLPIAGSQVLELANGGDPASSPSGRAGPDHTGGVVIGAVTSSCLSPMLGGVAVGFAMIRWGMHEPGTRVVVPAQGQMVPAVIHTLALLKS